MMQVSGLYPDPLHLASEIALLMNSRRDLSLLIVCAILATVIFAIDIDIRLGVAVPVCYVGMVLITLWCSRRSHTLLVAIVGSALTILGMLLSPMGENKGIYIPNRIIALTGIWTAAFVILRFKKEEMNTRKMRDSLNALFMYATEGIIIVNSSGKIEMINPEAENQFGYDKSELLGKEIELLIPEHHTKNHISHREKFFANPKPRVMGRDRELELSGRKKNGEEFPVEISLSSYKLDEEIFVVAFIINITERKKQEEQLKRSHEELKQYAVTLKETNAELENFAYISSHDLQEPLRKIQSFGDRLKTREADLSKEGKDYLERMLNASQRMQKLINDLLVFSRLTSKSQAYVLLDLNQIAAGVLEDMEVAIEKSNAHIEMEKLPQLIAEPTQMRQLFQNLIGNAIKFRKENESPLIRISSENISVDGERDFIRLVFEDNGIGFDEKYNEKIFGIFQRLEGNKYEGSGIGLAICKKIAIRHGGTITAKSIQDGGTTFTITLPVQQSNS